MRKKRKLNLKERRRKAYQRSNASPHSAFNQTSELAGRWGEARRKIKKRNKDIFF